MWGFGEQDGGQRPTAWRSPWRHRRGTPSPSCPWARRAWLPGPWLVGARLREKPSARLPICPPAPGKSSTQVPRPGVTRMAVIPAPMTGMARNSRLYQATGQPRKCGWDSVLNRAGGSSSDPLSWGWAQLSPPTRRGSVHHPESERWQVQVTKVKTGPSQRDHQVGVNAAGRHVGSTEDPTCCKPRPGFRSRPCHSALPAPSPTGTKTRDFVLNLGTYLGWPAVYFAKSSDREITVTTITVISEKTAPEVTRRAPQPEEGPALSERTGFEKNSQPGLHLSFCCKADAGNRGANPTPISQTEA